MHVLMLSDFEWGGGAGCAAGRLALGLLGQGLSVTRAVAGRDGGCWPWQTVPLAPPYASGRLFRASRALLPAGVRRVWDGVLARRWLEAVLGRVRPDVVNVHNIHDAGWPVSLVECCARRVPTVWTLHDMWSFTGRCVYTDSCRKFQEGCDAACPTHAEYPPLPAAAVGQEWRRKRDALRRAGRLAAVSPSEWLAGRAREGIWQSRRVEVIPNGVPLAVFRRIERTVARQALGLPVNRVTLLAGASDLRASGKGIGLLLEVLKRPGAWQNAVVLLFGRGQPDDPPGNVVHLGCLRDERTMALAYNAADIYVHPSLQDNLPNTILESIACGTPVVAFRTGGVPEMVRPGLTGWLAETNTAEGLLEALEKALENVGRNSLRDSCAGIAAAEYDVELQAARYRTLFASM